MLILWLLQGFLGGERHSLVVHVSSLAGELIAAAAWAAR
jgi:hypothetical protein